MRQPDQASRRGWRASRRYRRGTHRRAPGVPRNLIQERHHGDSLEEKRRLGADQHRQGRVPAARRDRKIPAVLYGHGADPEHLELPGQDS